jgi:3-hydroxyisobutyrate dehydrogenase
MDVAVIGVGAMGLAMAGHIVAKGRHKVHAFDIDPAQLAKAAGIGAAAAPSLAAAASRAQLFIIMVVDDRQVLDVAEQIAAAAAPGSILAVAATVHPDTMREAASRVASRGLRVIDAPVVYGMQGAREGRLVTLAAGDEGDVGRARDALMGYSREVHYLGGLGCGQMAKAANNMLHWTACIANFEVLMLAKAHGLDAQRLREVLLDCPGQNGTLRNWDHTRFTWPEKDMDIALDLAQARALSLPLAAQVDQLVKQLSHAHVRELLHGAGARYLGQHLPGRGQRVVGATSGETDA